MTAVGRIHQVGKVLPTRASRAHKPERGVGLRAPEMAESHAMPKPVGGPAGSRSLGVPRLASRCIECAGSRSEVPELARMAEHPSRKGIAEARRAVFHARRPVARARGV
jgi:hypothetical protein